RGCYFERSASGRDLKSTRDALDLEPEAPAVQRSAQLLCARRTSQCMRQVGVERCGEHLEAVTTMHGDDSARQVVVAAILQPGAAHHLQERFLVRMAADGL